MIYQHEFQWIEGLILDQICGTERNNFYVVFNRYSAQQAIGVFLHSRAKGEREFSFSVHWDTSQRFPRLADNLYANGVLFGDRDMLQKKSKNSTIGMQKFTCLAHCLPVIKPPVYSLIICNFDCTGIL
jgi:hypothetical protein